MSGTHGRTTMKVILLGNAGAGKSTLARQLMQGRAIARLPLDEVAFAEGSSERLLLQDSIAAVQAFIDPQPEWIIEGCYAGILEPVAAQCETLIFLNPGMDACVAHCRARPWEPEKFPTAAAQADHLANLIEWVRAYPTRDDEYGLARHRTLYDVFSGHKCELTDPTAYARLLV